MKNRRLSRPARARCRTRAFLSPLAVAGAIVWATTITLPAHADRLAGTTLAQKGGTNIPACMTCHGAKGEGQAAGGFPRLAGLSQAYLLKQLQAFAGGKRKNAVMEPIARSLDAGQMRDAADYYASLPAWQPTVAPDTTSAQYALGMKIATEGDWSKEMPACFTCHGALGKGVPPHFPALAGQPRSYTQAQLNAWKGRTRTNDPIGLMQAIGGKLTDAEIAAVSLFLENPSLAGKGK
jgi:cytochrome c553